MSDKPKSGTEISHRAAMEQAIWEVGFAEGRAWALRLVVGLLEMAPSQAEALKAVKALQTGVLPFGETEPKP